VSLGLFFVITSESNSNNIISWAHDLESLFDLIDRVYKIPDPIVYRYMPQNVKFDIWATWNEKDLRWEVAEKDVSEIGLQKVDLVLLRKNLEILRSMKV
jgi:hypothetical protein